ncbi:MAG: 50S ribosomal protein L24 [Dehalococcoidia bacterium]|nr:50S ribosomal protein L24 [Dehalococcoidia bacterium]
MKIRKNDTVIILSGKDKGRKGKVRRALPGENEVVVEGLNMIKRHSRARRAARQAGIIELEAPICTAKVKLVCNKCGKPTRVGFLFLEEGKKVRTCTSCGEVID